MLRSLLSALPLLFVAATAAAVAGVAGAAVGFQHARVSYERAHTRPLAACTCGW